MMNAECVFITQVPVTELGDDGGEGLVDDDLHLDEVCLPIVCVCVCVCNIQACMHIDKYTHTFPMGESVQICMQVCTQILVCLLV